jgi:quinol monooxygenase YgiN
MTTAPAFIAILDFSTAATDRPAAVAQLEREQPAVTAMPGCIAFRVYCNRQDDTGITVLHEWIDQASFDAYLASDAFARSGEILRPMMTGAPSSRRFRAELVETVA